MKDDNRILTVSSGKIENIAIREMILNQFSDSGDVLVVCADSNIEESVVISSYLGELLKERLHIVDSSVIENSIINKLVKDGFVDEIIDIDEIDEQKVRGSNFQKKKKKRKKRR